MATIGYRDFLRPLRVPAYAFLVVTLFFQMFDFVLAASPLRPTVLVWRFAILGSITNNVGNVVLLVLLLHWLVLQFGDRRPLPVLGSLMGVAAAVLFLSGGMFALDALQLRSRIDPQALSKFESASAEALVKFFIEGIVCLLFSISAFRSWGTAKKEMRAEKGNEDLLIVRAGAQRPSAKSASAAPAASPTPLERSETDEPAQ